VHGHSGFTFDCVRTLHCQSYGYFSKLPIVSVITNVTTCMQLSLLKKLAVPQLVKKMFGFRLPPRCRIYLRSSGILLSVKWQFCTDVSGQPIGPILWNLTVYCCIYNSPPLFPILSHINLVLFQQIYLRSVLILSSHLRRGLSSGLFPSRFLTKNPVCPSPIPHMCHGPYPSHLDLITCIAFGEENYKP
jgi:hypothetical protein